MIKHMLLTCCVVISAYTLYFSSPAYASTPGSSSSSGGPHSSTSTVDADYHYEPVSGKIIGVWPDEWTVQRLRQLRLEYGFGGVVIYESQDQYANALQAGFSPANIMVLTSNDSYIFASTTCPRVSTISMSPPNTIAAVSQAGAGCTRRRNLQRGAITSTRTDPVRSLSSAGISVVIITSSRPPTPIFSCIHPT